MKKTIPTSIAHTLFYVEEDAYTRLENYLSSIRTYFAGEPKEIVEDIESRIAEKLIEMTGNGVKDRIVTDAHILSVIQSLGTPSDFAEEAGAATKSKEGNETKKLYRDPDTAVIGGVASGLAAYFGIDVAIIRLIFVLSIFFGGTGILIYIILWIAIPEAKTTAQKLEMRGNPVTLDTMSEVVKEKVREFETRAPKMESAASNFFKKIAHLVQRILGGTVPLLGKIIGSLFSAIGTILFIALLISLIVSIINGPLYFFDPEFISLISLPVFFLALGIIFLLTALPALALIMVGSSLLGTLPKSSRAFGILLGLWILALVAAGTFAATVGARMHGYIEAAYRNASYEHTEERTLTPFTKLVVENKGLVTVTEGAESAIILRGTEKAVNEIEVINENGTLSIKRTRKDPCIFCFRNRVAVEIITPSLSEVIARNGSSITLTNTKTAALAISAETGSSIEVSGIFETLIITAKNGSHVRADGTVNSLALTVKNGSHVDTEALVAKEGQVEIGNGSHGTIQVSETLSGTLHNGSHLTQFGTAETETIKTDSSSHLE